MKSMKTTKERYCPSFSDGFYGTATVGERGQIVIPVDARSELEMHPGEKLMIMRHPVHSGLMIFKIDAVREFLDEIAQSLAKVEEMRDKEEETE